MSQGLQQRYDELEAAKAGLNPDNPDDRFRFTVIEQEQAQIRVQFDGVLQDIANAERLQKQAEEVAIILLPEDYDVRFGFLGANDEIRSLIGQVKEYLFSQHNDEIAKLQEGHAEYVRTNDADKARLIDLVADRDVEILGLEESEFRAGANMRTAQEQLIEAEKKRDNAIVAKEDSEAVTEKTLNENKSLKGQIDELEGMLRTYRSQAKAGVTGGLVLTSTLKPESEEERTARIDRERIEQINKGLLRNGLTPLPLPTSPAAEETAAAAEELEDERFLTDEDAHDASGLDEADEDLEVAREPLTLEGLNERVKALESFKTAFEIGFFNK